MPLLHGIVCPVSDLCAKQYFDLNLILSSKKAARFLQFLTWIPLHSGIFPRSQFSIFSNVFFTRYISIWRKKESFRYVIYSFAVIKLIQTKIKTTRNDFFQYLFLATQIFLFKSLESCPFS